MAETLIRDWLNTNEPRKMMIPAITLLCIINWQLNHDVDWDSAQCLTYNANYFQRLTLKSWYTNLEETTLNRCQQLPVPHKRLIPTTKTKPTNGLRTDRLILTNNRRTSNRPIWPTKDGSKPTNDWWQTQLEFSSLTDQSLSTDPNIIDWQTLFTWL